ncbi:MAG: stage V sporulation protein AD [Clostridia bacterium]|nr:stage V sporulation protein AD [Clostridia bacterium]
MSSGLIKLDTSVVAASAVVGKKEHDGPLGEFFDMFDETDTFGEATWEKSESEMQRRAFSLSLGKSKLKFSDIGAVFAGDLLNQCVGSAYGLLEFDIPYFGLYGACSTAAEGLILASVMVSSGYADHTAAVTSSHFCSAERQYRAPLEYGAQRSPTAQHTVTGSGAFIVGRGGKIKIVDAMPGIVVDQGITDVANMGAAMAPAVVSTLCRYFEATNTSPEEFDMILTGDLGFYGGDILCDLMLAEGFDIRKVYRDCGIMIYDREKQDMHAGGSGCGCSAVVLADHILPKMERGKIKNLLFLGTGAMMSPSSIGQGLSIPAVAHLVHFCV